MTDSDRILPALAEISAQRGGSFAIVHTDVERNCFAQFLADDEPGLYVEVVGDEFLAPADRLTILQQADMRARGWTMEPGPNWSQQWPDDSTDAQRRQIALAALSALRDVYGAAGPVEIEVEIEGGEAPPVDSASPASQSPPPGSQRAVWAVAIAALLVALAIALIASAA